MKIVRKHKCSQAAFSILEVLVAISLLGIVMASSAKVIILSMEANTATRSYASVISDVQDIIDNYRGQSYVTLLSNFGTDFSAITNGQTVTSTVTSTKSRATYTVSLIAQKSTSNSNPETVQVRVQAVHRRGSTLKNADYDFSTLISQAR